MIHFLNMTICVAFCLSLSHKLAGASMNKFCKQPGGQVRLRAPSPETAIIESDFVCLLLHLSCQSCPRSGSKNSTSIQPTNGPDERHHPNASRGFPASAPCQVAESTQPDNQKLVCKESTKHHGNSKEAKRCSHQFMGRAAPYPSGFQ